MQMQSEWPAELWKWGAADVGSCTGQHITEERVNCESIRI